MQRTLALKRLKKHMQAIVEWHPATEQDTTHPIGGLGPTSRATEIVALWQPTQLRDFELRMSTISADNRDSVVKCIATYTNVMAQQAAEDQTRTLAKAARELFQSEMNPRLRQLVNPLTELVNRLDRPWAGWTTHAATAVTSSIASCALMAYLHSK